jgi:L-ascorbate metabolism protein UlaG (beta-lactamase superfamily)
MSSTIRRRSVLRGAVLAGAAATSFNAEPAHAGPRRSSGVTLRWLGVAGWQVDFDGHVVFFDPYLSRFDYVGNGGRLAPDPAVVDRLLADGRLAGPPEVIMVSHGHFDHLSDVPQLLARTAPGGAWANATIRTIGTDTVRNLLIASGAPLKSHIEAFGGEDLDFAGGAYRVQVLRSLHSQSKGYGYAYPGLRVAPPPAPTSITELVEGGTLAYLFTATDRLSVLFTGGTNFVERELAGLRPDVVMVCLTDYSSVHRYLERLLTVLGGPKYAIPVHHDDMMTGYDDPNLPNTVNQAAVTALKQAVRQLRLRTEVLTPAHLEPLTL